MSPSPATIPANPTPIRALLDVIEKTPPHLYGNARSRGFRRLVHIVLAKFANPDGTGIYASKNLIAALCLSSDRNVQRAINYLISVNLVRRLDAPHEAYFTTQYELMMPSIKVQEATEAKRKADLTAKKEKEKTRIAKWRAEKAAKSVTGTEPQPPEDIRSTSGVGPENGPASDDVMDNIVSVTEGDVTDKPDNVTDRPDNCNGQSCVCRPSSFTVHSLPSNGGGGGTEGVTHSKPSTKAKPTGKELLAKMQVIFKRHLCTTWNQRPKVEVSLTNKFAEKYGPNNLLNGFEEWCSEDAEKQLETKDYDGFRLPLMKFWDMAEHYIQLADRPEARISSCNNAIRQVSTTERETKQFNFIKEALQKANPNAVLTRDCCEALLLVFPKLAGIGTALFREYMTDCVSLMTEDDLRRAGEFLAPRLAEDAPYLISGCNPLATQPVTHQEAATAV